MYIKVRKSRTICISGLAIATHSTGEKFPFPRSTVVLYKILYFLVCFIILQWKAKCLSSPEKMSFNLSLVMNKVVSYARFLH